MGDVVQPCAGGIVFDQVRRLLVVLRGHAPAAGTWSVPGGRCLPGEDARDACIREIREETGLDVEIVHFAGRVTRGHYVIDDFVCRLVNGSSPRAGDDADAARWVTRTELRALPLTPLLYETLDEWGVLPD